MVRWLPPPVTADGELPFGHDAVTFSFLVACVAATVTLASSMCSACGRKPKAATNADPAGTGSSVSGGSGSQEAGGAEEAAVEEEVVRLSPELAMHGAIEPVALPSSTSRRRLSISVSKKLSLNIPDKLRLSRREHKDHHHHKVESEDTLWKKGIILGEKCRIPGEREAECADPDDDDIAAANFRRSSYSRPVSRSSSFAMHQPQHDAPGPALHASDT
ncbi:uncharacterized protein [Zea mays]|jgi:hypothetical protein|uniref:Uncharacterized protein n=1 Tax=Zea mays TaxID=4577 RepID=A0A1D6LL67_MAIZE|nr:uncharacterized protein LOC103629491 [Zea mays]AQK80431.1 hypothetical protein ZEAMMB73_Zm00001d036199 [Zea mays]|eukprot:XP_008648818.1 uncharacterized protein LOC103629491 [Zea mays]